MKVLVIYDSYFGNTEKVARAIGTAFEPKHEVKVNRIIDIALESIKGIDLLVVGSPTRGFNPSEATLAFLKGLTPGSLDGIKVAAFDTRVDMSKQKSGFLRFIGRFFRYAAEPTAAALVNAGGKQVLAPAGFFVEDREGPLREGELERAVAWVKPAC